MLLDDTLDDIRPGSRSAVGSLWRLGSHSEEWLWLVVLGLLKALLGVLYRRWLILHQFAEGVQVVLIRGSVAMVVEDVFLV